MTNGLNLILRPAYEPGDGKADGAQLVDGEWWHPIFGCDSLQRVVDNVRSMLQLPPNYIDPEHKGQDLEMLQAFYQACRSEGGTADEIHLKGIKAALATLQAALPVPSAPGEDWAAVAAFAQDMRARGLAEQAHGDELLKLANQRAALRLSGVAPSTPAPLPTEEEIATWLHLKVDSPVYLAEPGQPEGDGPAYWAERVPLIILEALKRWGQVAPTRDDLDSLCGPPTLKDVEATNAQPAAIAQPAEGPTDDELLRTYGAAKRNHQYDGPSDDWPNRAERAATVCGLRAVIARHGRPTFQPIPASERLPGPEDCTPWRDDPTALPWCWAAKDVDGWEWIQLSMGHLHGNLGGIMPGHGYTHWAPWWAIPLPGATEIAGQVKE